MIWIVFRFIVLDKDWRDYAYVFTRDFYLLVEVSLVADLIFLHLMLYSIHYASETTY